MPGESRAESSVEQPKQNKNKLVLALLRQPGGASLAEIMSMTDWQAHSARGFLSGIIRKKLGLNLASDVVTGIRRYRIVADAKQETGESHAPASPKQKFLG